MKSRNKTNGAKTANPVSRNPPPIFLGNETFGEGLLKLGEGSWCVKRVVYSASRTKKGLVIASSPDAKGLRMVVSINLHSKGRVLEDL